MTVKKTLEKKGGAVPKISPNANMAEALAELQKDEISALVVTADGRHIDGILTTADLASGMHKHKGKMLDLAVKDVMRKNVITCDYGDKMLSVYRLMIDNHVRHVPVTKDGEVCGLINILDCIGHRLDELESETSDLRKYVSGSH